MEIVHTRSALDVLCRNGCVLVPTMGALHEGHDALIEHALDWARSTGSKSSTVAQGDGPQLPVVVSIFVNPTQFNESSDFARYPRVLDEDCSRCDALGVDVVFAPAPEEVYPPDEEVPVGPIPAVATEPGLEDAFRPGHFAGVCQVCRRLFVLANARAAAFGEKDWQQLQTVRAMSSEEQLGVKILPVSTVREADGLALSSRNRLLDETAREAALAISQALDVASCQSDPSLAERMMLATLAEHGRGLVEPEYAVVRDASTLGPVRVGKPARALIAAMVGQGQQAVRLIDNAPWPAAGLHHS